MYGKYGACAPRNRPRVPPRGNKTAKNDKTLETTTTSKKARHQVVLSTLFDIRSHFFPPVQLISCSIRESRTHTHTHTCTCISISISIQEKSLLFITPTCFPFCLYIPRTLSLASLVSLVSLAHTRRTAMCVKLRNRAAIPSTPHYTNHRISQPDKCATKLCSGTEYFADTSRPCMYSSNIPCPISPVCDKQFQASFPSLPPFNVPSLPTLVASHTGRPKS